MALVHMYTNIAAATFSANDFVIDFAVKGPGDDASKIDPEEIVSRLHLSPQHVKALVAHLAERLSQYEQIYGAINLEADGEAFARVTEQAAARNPQ